MTANQRWLLAAATEAQALLEAQARGKPSKGQYEIFEVGRALAAAIRAVQHDEAAVKKGAAA